MGMSLIVGSVITPYPADYDFSLVANYKTLRGEGRTASIIYVMGPGV
jgi:hypothetical protein